MDNYECMGYVIKSMSELEYSREDIEKMLYELKHHFDRTTEFEAGKVYDKFMGM